MDRSWVDLDARKSPQNDPGSFSAALSMTLGVENGGKIARNRSERGSGSENGDFFCKNAEVQQSMCFTSPNCSPHNPESTKIGQGERKIKKKIQKHAQKNASEKEGRKKVPFYGSFRKSDEKKVRVTGSFWKSDVSATTATAMRGRGEYLPDYGGLRILFKRRLPLPTKCGGLKTLRGHRRTFNGVLR